MAGLPDPFDRKAPLREWVGELPLPGERRAEHRGSCQSHRQRELTLHRSPRNRIETYSRLIGGQEARE